jgi:hypothetical protein
MENRKHTLYKLRQDQLICKAIGAKSILVTSSSVLVTSSGANVLCRSIAIQSELVAVTYARGSFVESPAERPTVV